MTRLRMRYGARIRAARGQCELLYATTTNEAARDMIADLYETLGGTREQLERAAAAARAAAGIGALQCGVCGEMVDALEDDMCADCHRDDDEAHGYTIAERLRRMG